VNALAEQKVVLYNTFIVPVVKNKYFLKTLKLSQGDGGGGVKEGICFPTVTPSQMNIIA